MKIIHTPGPGGKGIAAAIKGLRKAQGRVGWFPSAVYEDGTPVALVASVQEFGSPSKGIPPRLGMRTTQIEKQGEWREVSAEAARGVMNGTVAPEHLMEAICLKAEGDLREHITKVQTPALKPATIRARQRRSASGEASSKPLNDTGYMLATLTSETSKK